MPVQCQSLRSHRSLCRCARLPSPLMICLLSMKGYRSRISRKKTRALLKTLQKHRVKAIGFVNEDKLYIKQSEVNARIGILEAWLDAGMELGNHNLGHLGLQNTPLAAYEAAVLKGEAV